LLFGGTQLNIENAQYSQELIEIYWVLNYEPISFQSNDGFIFVK
jgi:hypothetical protein